MTEETRKSVSREAVEEVLARFRFGCHAQRWFWGGWNPYNDDDLYNLERLVSRLSNDISQALPTLQPDLGMEVWRGLSAVEWTYSRRVWGELEMEPPILPAVRDGWGLRRIHREMVDMLRALIALDPERLSQYDVVIPSEEVANIEEGVAVAADLAVSERNRIDSSSVEGHLLRYGIYIGLAMALEGKTEHGDLADFARQIAKEVGAKDPLERPAYPKTEEEYERLIREREEKTKP